MTSVLSGVTTVIGTRTIISRPSGGFGTRANWIIRTQARPLQENRVRGPPGKPCHDHSGLPEVSQAQQVRLVIETRHRSSYLLEGPLCQQAAAVEVDDRVCAPDGRQPMRDGDRRHF
jgi:hypothetical protein